MSLARSGSYLAFNDNNAGVIQPAIFDPILQNMSHLVNGFTYITYEAAQLPDSTITKITASDKGQVLSFVNQIFGA